MIGLKTDRKSSIILIKVVRDGEIVTVRKGENQFFVDKKNSIELWEKRNGLDRLVKRFSKKSVLWVVERGVK